MKKIVTLLFAIAAIVMFSGFWSGNSDEQLKQERVQ